MSSRVEISKRLVLINSASSLVTRLLSISVLIWLQQYLLKRITPEEYSLLPLVYSIMMFAPLVTTILTSGLGRYIVEAYAKDDDERVIQIVSTMFPILCAAGLIFLAGGWTFAWHIDKVLNIAPDRLWDARIMMALLMFSSAVALPMSPFGTGFFVRQKFVLLNLIGVGIEMFRLSILFTLLFGVSTRVLWVVTASVGAGMLGQTINLIVSRRLVPTLRFRASHIHWPIAREITSFGGWRFVASLAHTVRMSADVIILNKFATPLDVTCFHVGSMPLRHIGRTAASAMGPLAPVLTVMHATGDTTRLRNAYLRSGRLGLWAIMFIALPLMIYSKEVVNLYVGERYAASATVMVLLLSLHALGYWNVLMPQIANATAQIRPFAIRQVFIHGANVMLTLYLVGVLKKGAVGSALATFVVVICLGIPLLLPFGLRLADVAWVGWLREIVLPGMSPALVGTGVWVMLKFTVQPESWLTLILCASAGCACYVAILFVFCLRPEDRKDVSRIAGKIELSVRAWNRPDKSKGVST